MYPPLPVPVAPMQWTVADSDDVVADITLADQLDIIYAIEDAPEAAATGPTMLEIGEAFLRLDLSQIPPQFRAYAAFEAGIRFAQEHAK